MTTAVPFTVYEVVSAIIDGHLDGELESITNAIDTRSKVNASKRAAMLKVGDKIRFQSGRPKYLLGLYGTIVDKKQKNLVVKFDETDPNGNTQYRGKYTGRVTCPPNLLEAVEA